MQKRIELYLRNIIFGVSDSLVSTVGLLSGIDVVGTTRATVVLTGVIYAFVEAFSMAVGSFLSEQSAEQYITKGEADLSNPLFGGTVMFISSVLASFVPILPYMLFAPAAALIISIALSVIALFILGILSARTAKIGIMRQGIGMALLGGLAIVIGVVVGKLVRGF